MIAGMFNVFGRPGLCDPPLPGELSVDDWQAGVVMAMLKLAQRVRLNPRPSGGGVKGRVFEHPLRFLELLFGQPFRTFPQTFRSRLPQVRSPDRVKWPNLQQTLQPRHNHSGGEKGLKLSGFSILPSTYNLYISYFLHR